MHFHSGEELLEKATRIFTSNRLDKLSILLLLATLLREPQTAGYQCGQRRSCLAMPT